MILYFSATGNCKYVAKRIAEAIGTEFVSIADVDSQKVEGVHGIVAPTYSWGIPSILQEFLQTHEISKAAPSLFYVTTFGTTPGQSFYWAEKALKAGSGIKFDALFSVQMPDTWTPIFDLSDERVVAKKNEKAEKQIDEVVTMIKSGATGNHVKRKMPAIARVVYPRFYDGMRRTSNFSVEESCISCGICAKKCPVQAIEMKDGRPTWVFDQCVMCLGCLHRCPKFAIQYGKNTKKHGQYRNPHVKI
ncbi:MAG: EFR1 family ferrodoxin [Phoenicibacter congonensis]|uniref:EFR1 family ferrodoxin n=1 Tax=Phoenicibacter congonensis TaxID=1944646 RepID=A0AA43RIG0_9ACTN|nr:EFR1 family ferrodoxin [Phoenicibacter congonensis]